MKTAVFAVVSALAAVSLAAPQHRQTTINRATQSPATIFDDSCWRVCWFEVPKCPAGWVLLPPPDSYVENNELICVQYSNNKGTASHPCWTCCKSPPDSSEAPSVSSTPDKAEIDINIKISDTSVAHSASSLFEDPCWKVCWRQAPKCPNGWYSNNKGTGTFPCWTCCKSPSDSSETASISSTPDKEEIDINIKISDTSAANSASSLFEDPCWKDCWEFIPKCPDGMYSNNKGTASYPCWTCCVSPTGEDAAADYIVSSPSEEDIEVDIQISETTSTSLANIFEDPCWKVCWEFVPKCPDGMYSNNKGTASYPCWTCCFSAGVDDTTSHRSGLTVDL